MASEKVTGSDWRFMQIGVVVRDMDQAINSLSALGFGPFKPKYLPPGSKSAIPGKPTVSKNDVQRTTIGNVELELISPVSGNSMQKEFLDNKGEGVHHVLFEVKNLDEELDKLKAKGGTILRHLSFNDDGGLAFVDLNSSGLVLELIQLPKDPEALKFTLSRD
jgi:methylmalonyl-CoA/ethylmalonyl-CoA epimerase